MDRRTFLSKSAALIAGGSALGRTALSYGKTLGANDRISLCHVGNGSRGEDLDWIVAQLASSKNVEMSAVCDLWRLNREKAVAANQKYHGRAPRAFQHIEDVLAADDIDAVILSTPDHSHSPLLKMAAEAGKDAYVEKPMGNVLKEAKAARDAVRQHNRIVQVGTQHRSEPHPRAAQELVQTGVLGEVSKVEIVWNYHGPRWRGRPETKRIREEDTDWRKFLLNKPYRPSDPQVYCEFRLYKEFSSGIPDQWMSHAIDLVHWFMNDSFPRSAVAHGGVFAWHDGRENADTFQTLLEYFKGFLVSYSTSFGNDAPDSRGTWARRRRSRTLAAKEVLDISWSRRKEHTKTTTISMPRENRNMSCCPVKPSCRPWASTTARLSTWRTGSNACARDSSPMRRLTMASRIRSLA
jgi:predicted dehydrogenase